jgi:hypothetical protein
MTPSFGRLTRSDSERQLQADGDPMHIMFWRIGTQAHSLLKGKMIRKLDMPKSRLSLDDALLNIRQIKKLKLPRCIITPDTAAEEAK